MRTYYFALGLKNDPFIIAEYERWHSPGNVWPEVRKSILNAGITNMQIYRTGNRLMMVTKTTDSFDAHKKSIDNTQYPKVMEWELLMSQFQQPLPWAKEG